MRSALSSCRLYSWMRLTGSRRSCPDRRDCPDVALSQSAKRALASRLALRTASRKRRVVGQRLQLAQLGEVGDPAVADRLGDTPASAGLASSSQRRGVTPLVLLLKRSGNISARSLTVVVRSRLGMDRGDAVGAVRADDREIGHADLALGAFLDQAHARDAALIARKAAPHLVEKAAVDLVDDLQVARQQHLEPARPAISPAPRAAACGSCRPASAG